jgi:NAD(P)-dependent dehydrogenase (short-subunit alcohol dehydrogenase family)
MGSLQNKLIVVTGGSRGIGKEIAFACAREGAKVIITARSEGELKKTAEEIVSSTGSPCSTVVCDVSSTQDILKLVQAIRPQSQKLYGLVCAAGIYGSIGSFLDTPFEEWEKAIDVNLKGTALTIHQLAPFMKNAPASEGGRVIVFSGGGQGAMPNFSSYVTSKGAIWRLTETLAAELASHQIYLNAVAPGAVNTKLLDELLEAGPSKVGYDFYQKSLKQKNQGGESAKKAADLCLHLLSKAAHGLYGKTISAIWDPYSEWDQLEALSKSDIYTYKRVIDSAGNTRGK